MKQRETILASGVSSEPPIHTQATARPWTACRQTLGSKVIGFHIAGRPYGSSLPICSTGNPEQFAPELEANATLIVKAVNSHEALVKALAIAENEMRYAGWAVEIPDNVGRKIAYDEVCAALAGVK